MQVWIRQLWTLAGLSALESVRQPVVLLATASAVAFVGLMPIVFTHTLGEADRLVRDSALALHWVLGLVLGVLMACTSLRAELRSGTASAILSKPVPRPLFFVGKFAGLAAVLLAFSLLMLCANLLATRTARMPFLYDWWGSGPLFVALALALVAGGLQNFLWRRPFASRAFGALLFLLPLAVGVSGAQPPEEAQTAWGAALPLALIPAGALLALAILLLAAIALALATRFEVTPTLALCSVLFLWGLMSDYLLGRAAQHNRWLAALDGLTPNFQHYWSADALAGHGIPWAYVGQTAAYTVFYLAAVLSAGILAFRRMEMRG